MEDTVSTDVSQLGPVIYLVRTSHFPDNGEVNIEHHFPDTTSLAVDQDENAACSIAESISYNRTVVKPYKSK